jgi:hypothetical protein
MTPQTYSIDVGGETDVYVDDGRRYHTLVLEVDRCWVYSGRHGELPKAAWFGKYTGIGLPRCTGATLAAWLEDHRGLLYAAAIESRGVLAGEADQTHPVDDLYEAIQAAFLDDAAAEGQE